MIKNLNSLAPVPGEEAPINAYGMNGLDTGNACEPMRNSGTPLSKVYPSVACNEAYLTGIAECSPGLAVNIAAWGRSGYTLADGYLVPSAFIEEVRDELFDTMLHFGDVIKVEDLFTASFLEALDSAERDVLSHVVMRLIEMGSIALHFPSPTERTA